MKYRKLGKSGIKVSEIGFGAWTIGLDWWGKKIDDEEAIRMLKRAYDLGINFYETADIYGKGRSEKLIAQVFKDMRNEVVYSTKWGYDMYSVKQVGHSELPQKHNQEFLQFALGQSLSRLQTVYNILEQDPARDFMRAAERHNIGITVRVPDASGLLTGKVSTNTKFDKNDHRSFRKQEFIVEAMQKIENMKPSASSKGWNITELAIKFILSQKQISLVLPTMISVEEIEMFASLSDGNYLNSIEVARMEEMYEKNFYVEPVAK